MNKLLACTAALLLLFGTQTTLADGRRDRDRGHSHYDNHNSHRGWDRHDRWNRADRWDRRRDRVSLSVNVGTLWPNYTYSDWRYRDYYRATSGLGVAYTTAWGTPVWGYNNRPVIVHQNTYVNTAPRTRVITRSTRSSGSSLLRDINGRCFERETDRYGNETRSELPAESCNF